MTLRSRSLALLMFLATVGLVWPSEVAAQRPAPPRTARTGVAVPRPAVAPRVSRPFYGSRYFYGYGYPRFYYPYYPRFYSPYYSSFAFSFGFGWPAAYWGPYGYPYYGYPYYGYPSAYPYPYYWDDNSGSARLQISPRNAQVYVDGRFVGVVDDFDGSFERLRVEAGQHQLQIYLEGYRTYTENVLFTPGRTVNLGGTLEPLGPGEAPQPKPAPAPAARSSDPYQRPTPAPPQREGQPAEFGTLSIRVMPLDAVILIDGEQWDRQRGEERFSIELGEGPHQVEIRKEGFRPYARTVDIRRGRTFTLNVSLTPGGPGPLQVTTRSGVIARGPARY